MRFKDFNDSYTKANPQPTQPEIRETILGDKVISDDTEIMESIVTKLDDISLKLGEKQRQPIDNDNDHEDDQEDKDGVDGNSNGSDT